MLDFIRIACAVPPVRVGDTRKNAEEICRMLASADEQQADLLVLPELSLTDPQKEQVRSWYERNPNSSVSEDMPVLLQAENIDFTYDGGLHALRGVSVTVHKGEMLSMIYYRLSDRDNTMIYTDMITKLRVDIDSNMMSIKFDKEYKDYYYTNQTSLLNDYNRIVLGLGDIEDVIEGTMEPITHKENFMRR